MSPAPSVDVAALFTKAMRVPLRADASVEGDFGTAHGIDNDAGRVG
jgi:hypothetical protein